MAVLYRNDAFSNLVLSTKKRFSSFFKKVFIFQKICFKVKVLAMISTWKHVDLSNGGLIWKSLVRVFRRTYALSVGFETKPLRKSVFQCKDKNQPKFCRKTYWKVQPFIFTVYLMNHIFQTSVLLIRVIQCIIELNWLCKHIKKVRSSQPAILVLNWIEDSFSLRVSSIYIQFKK